MRTERRGGDAQLGSCSTRTIPVLVRFEVCGVVVALLDVERGNRAIKAPGIRGDRRRHSLHVGAVRAWRGTESCRPPIHRGLLVEVETAVLPLNAFGLELARGERLVRLSEGSVIVARRRSAQSSP